MKFSNFHSSQKTKINSLYREFRTFSGKASFFNSITILIPSLSDSSLIPLIPSIFLSLANSAILSTNRALLTL